VGPEPPPDPLPVPPVDSLSEPPPEYGPEPDISPKFSVVVAKKFTRFLNCAGLNQTGRTIKPGLAKTVKTL